MIFHKIRFLISENEEKIVLWKKKPINYIIISELKKC